MVGSILAPCNGETPIRVLEMMAGIAGLEDMGPMGPFIVAVMIGVPTLLLMVLLQRFWRSYKSSRKVSEKMGELEREFLRIRAEAEAKKAKGDSSNGRKESAPAADS